jgi:hypothetical protein
MNLFIRWIAVILAGGLGCSAFGQSVPRVPAVDVSKPNRVLNIKADDVCAIDFPNTQMFGENESWSARLKNGSYRGKSHSANVLAILIHAFCLKDKDGVERALVTTNWAACAEGCTRTGVVQLFELRASQPVITQQFAFNSHAEGTGATFDEKSLTLTITGRSDDGSPNCCARNLDLVTYRWQGTEFNQASYERVPAPESKLLASLEYDNYDFPNDVAPKNTCLTVLRDGRFSMGQVSTWHPGTPEFFADTLPDEGLKALNAILEAPALKQLRTADPPKMFTLGKGKMLSARIPRGDTEQSLWLAAVRGPAGQSPTFPASVGPLVQWIETTSKAINQRKLGPVKDAKSVGTCWFDKR